MSPLGPGSRWKRIDRSTWLKHCPDHEQRWLVYGRTYIPRANPPYSPTNQLIWDLKNFPASTSARKRKQDAINCFASEVSGLLSSYPNLAFFLVPMPPSKASGHPQYDNRIATVARKVAQSCKNVSYAPLLYQTVSVPSSHQNPACRRSPEQIYQSFSINESFVSSYKEGDFLVLLDDVLTSGAHLAAASRRLSERFSGANIGGIFWAKTLSEDENEGYQH